MRAETGQLARFGVRAFNFAIESIDYDATVTDRIKQQQGITMAVQTSIANAKKAIQDAVTAAGTRPRERRSDPCRTGDRKDQGRRGSGAGARCRHAEGAGGRGVQA